MKCMIWNTSATDITTADEGVVVYSPRAGGQYSVSGSDSPNLHSLSQSKKLSLTSWLVNWRIAGKICPEISSATLDEISSTRMLALTRAHYLLRYLYPRADLRGRNDLLGTVVEFNETGPIDITKVYQELLAWTASTQMSEVKWLAESCNDRGWVKFERTSRKHWGLTLSLLGHEYLNAADLD